MIDAEAPVEGTGAPVAEPIEAAVETPAEPEPEPRIEVTTPPAAPRSAAAVRFGTVVLAAALSGALGVGAALIALPYGLRGIEPPLPDPTLTHRINLLEARPAVSLDAIEARLTALETAPAPVNDLGAVLDRLTALEGSMPDLSPLDSRLRALETAPAPTPVDTSSLDARITRLEGDLSAAIDAQARAAVDAAFAEARSQADQQAAALAAQQAQLAASEANVTRQAALAELTAAAESGAAAPEALALLGEVPPALAPLGEGLVTLTALQDAFAPAARAALAAAPPPEQASLADRLTGFLRAQTGARSLAPREGTDADAVLSRAEAALRDGDLQTTLAELAQLTGAPAEAMATWRADAQTRLDALTALATPNGG